MKALISPLEILKFIDGSTGTRVAQVTEEDFPVAAPLFWVECPDEVAAETHHWTGEGFALNLDPYQEPDPAHMPTLSSGTIPVEIL